MALSCGFLAAQKLHKTCTNCTELLCSAPHPLHLYPHLAPKLHPNVQLNAPAPRINSRIFLFVKAQGDGAANCPHHLKVANPAASVAQTSPARCVSEREKGGDFALRESRTVGSGTPLVTFVVKRKSPGCRAERLHWRSRGHPPPQNLPRCGIKKKKPKKVLAKKANLYDNKGEPK